MRFRMTCDCGVFVASAVITIAVIAVLAWSGWHEYRHTFDHGAQLTRQVARLAGEHVQRYITAPEQALRRIDQHFHDRDPADLDSAAARAYLRDVLADLPEANALAIIDRTGVLILFTGEHPIPAIDVSRRFYFQTHLSNPQGNVIGPLIAPRAHGPEGGYRFTISRPLIRNGAFAGVVLASVYVERMETFMQGLDLAPDAATIVFTRDGWVIARHQILPEHVTTNFADLPLFTEHLPNAPTGTYIAKGATDGTERIFTYHAQPDSQLVAVVGLPVDGLFAEWASHFARSSLVALGLLAVTWCMLWTVWRSTRREQNLISDLEKALADNKVLFNEIHHRVKNNMQIINSMLMMEQVRSRDPIMSERLDTLAGRISSMALVHVMLYERQEASHVNVAAYLNELCGNLSASFAAAERGITVIVDCDASSLPIEKAVPVGLLVNEAVSNAFKHAFPEDRGPGMRGGSIRIFFTGRADGLHISVSDDGVGMPLTTQALPHPATPRGLGLSIMEALAGQLDGTAKFVPGSGTLFQVWCPA